MHLIVCFHHVTFEFQSESTLYSWLNFKELLARSRRHIWRLSNWNGIRTHNHLVPKRTPNHLDELAKWLSWVVSTYLYGAFDCIFLSCHVRVWEWLPLYSCLNVKELLARKRRHIWRLSDCNGIRTHNHLVRKRTSNHLAKLSKWLNWVVSTYMQYAFDCMFLSCHVRVWEWIHTLQLPECQGTPCSKQAPYLKIKWLQRDSNPQSLSL